MRLLLLILGLVAAAFTAALFLGQRLLDRDTLRAELIDRLAAATGADVAAGGPVEIELLPQPRLVMAELVLDLPGTDARLAIDRAEIGLAAAPLLRGQAVIANARLVRPRLTLPRPPQSLGELGALLPDGAALPFRAVQVLDGAVSVAGAPPQAHGLDLALEVDELSGGLTVEGTGTLAGQALRLDLETSAFTREAPMSLRLEVALGPPEQEVALRYRGSLQPARDGPPASSGEVQLALADLPSGSALLADLLPAGQAAAAARTAGRLLEGALALNARLEVHGPAWRLDELRLVGGGSDLSGSLAWERPAAAEPVLTAELVSTRLRLPDTVPALLAGGGGDWPAPPPGLTGRIRLAVGALDWRDGVVRQLRLEAALGGDGNVALERLSADLPGGIAVRASGTYATSNGPPAVEADLDAAGEDLQSLLAWAGVPAEELPAGRLRGVSLTGRLRLTPAALALRDAELRLDASRATGSMALVTVGRPQLALKAEIDRLTLDDYGLGPAELASLAQGGLVDGLDAALDLRIERLGWHELRPEGVSLRLDLQRGRLRVDELAMTDLAGARLRIVGDHDLRQGSWAFAGEAEIPSPSRLARAFAVELPAPVVALGAFRASATGRSDGRSGELELQLDNPFLAIGVDAATAAPPAWPPRALRASVELAAPGLRELLLRLGAQGFDQPALAGPLDGRLDVTSAPDGGHALTLALEAGRMRLEGELLHGEAASPPSLAGRLAARHLDAGALLDLYRALEPALGLPAGPLRSWPGAWPRRKLDWTWLEKAALDLALEASLVDGSRPLGDAGARLALEDGRLRLEEIGVPLAGGRLHGGLELAHAATGPQLAFKLGLEGADAAGLLHALRAGEALDGVLDLELEARSQGLALADLVGNLEGDGQLALRRARLDLVSDGAAGPLELAAVEGRFGVVRGVAQARPPLNVTGGGRIEARFDLLAWLLAARLELPDAPPIEVLGPPDAPYRLETAEAAGPEPAAP
ncbi:AsmA family protein [Marinimicrococcus flavescens]|uniref:AsmA-like C-terminal region-containing protein n=1 Tax=Marinimicrococcus flavescens TaxID=3031815 RepID=A0AAP3UZX1_9PROT|nr:AsmA-like C-terminal region-containing protein [Marinimicrococcus flavescens]